MSSDDDYNDSVVLSEAYSEYDWGCFRICDWDTHPLCPEHMGEDHATKLMEYVSEPMCRFCYDLLPTLRSQYIGEHALAICMAKSRTLGC